MGAFASHLQAHINQGMKFLEGPTGQQLTFRNLNFLTYKVEELD